MKELLKKSRQQSELLKVESQIQVTIYKELFIDIFVLILIGFLRFRNYPYHYRIPVRCGQALNLVENFANLNMIHIKKKKKNTI